MVPHPFLLVSDALQYDQKFIGHHPEIQR